MPPPSKSPERHPPAEVVIVTGASRGVGLEVCRQFASRGSAVGMIARHRDDLDRAARGLPGRSHPVAADVADRGGLSEAVAAIESALGPPTVLVNNAGHGQWGAVVDTDPDEFRRAIDVNYLGTVHATHLVLEGMLRRGSGHIVNVASIVGRIGGPFEAAYSASKFAVVGYTEALAVELTGSGVGVSLVDPGPIATEFFERRGHPRAQRWPRALPAEKVAKAVVDAVDHRRAERFVPGWLRGAHAMKTLVPPAHRVVTGRMFAAERAALLHRFR